MLQTHFKRTLQKREGADKVRFGSPKAYQHISQRSFRKLFPKKKEFRDWEEGQCCIEGA
jgi:hypothetical protein